MDTKNKILDQIFKLLAPLRTLYKDEVEKVTNDLLIGYTDSLNDFINKYYSNTSYSEELVSLIMNLVNQGLIPSSYLDEVNKEVSKESVYKQVSVRPLNVKIMTFNNIQRHKDLRNIDLTKFPVSLVEEKHEEIPNIPQIEIKETNPNLTPVEITPDENTKPDITLPKDDTELPSFDIKGEPSIDFSIPDTTPPLEIPPIMVTPPTLESQEVMSKDDILNSLQTPSNQEEDISPDLKNTSQFGQLLQFPLNQGVMQPDAPVVYQDNYQVPTPDVTNQEVPVEVPKVETPITYQDEYQVTNHEVSNQEISQPETPVEVPKVETPIAYQDEYQVTNHEVSNQEISQETPVEVPKVETPIAYQDNYQVPNPDVTNQEVPIELPKPETSIDYQDNYQVPTPEVNNQEINQPETPVEVPKDEYQIPKPETSIDYQDNYQVPTPEVNNQEVSIELPNPETHITYQDNYQPKEEQLNEEIEAKIREEVKKQVEQIRLEEKNNIVRIQNDYLNNANLFIQSLNEKSEEEIYMSLRYLNDLKYMSHCIAHLNMNTLERFYRFIEDKINSPQSEFMDGFIEKRIRENLPNSLIEEINQESKKIA